MLFNNYLKRNYLIRPIYVLNIYLPAPFYLIQPGQAGVLFSMMLSSFFHFLPIITNRCI